MHVNNLFYCRQFGFRSKMSTLQALADITELIRNNFHHDVSCMLLDLTKAFDTIIHEISLFNLEGYGVRGICSEWFSSSVFKHPSCWVWCTTRIEYRAAIVSSTRTSIIFQALVMILYHSCTQMILTVCIFDRKMLLRHFKIKLSICRRGWQHKTWAFILERLSLSTSWVIGMKVWKWEILLFIQPILWNIWAFTWMKIWPLKLMFKVYLVKWLNLYQW